MSACERQVDDLGGNRPAGFCCGPQPVSGTFPAKGPSRTRARCRIAPGQARPICGKTSPADPARLRCCRPRGSKPARSGLPSAERVARIMSFRQPFALIESLDSKKKRPARGRFGGPRPVGANEPGRLVQRPLGVAGSVGLPKKFADHAKPVSGYAAERGAARLARQSLISQTGDARSSILPATPEALKKRLGFRDNGIVRRIASWRHWPRASVQRSGIC